MSSVSFYILAGMLLVVAVLQIVKQRIYKKMQSALDNGDYDGVITAAGSFFAKYLYRPYVLDLFRIRAYYLKKDVENFETLLRKMVVNDAYKPAERKEVMELYYHTFLFKENQKYCDELLEAIKQTKDEKMIAYDGKLYEIVFQDRTDMIEEMEEMINSKKYYGIPLGMILYGIALQYEKLADYEQAEVNFRTSLSCFYPDSIYAEAARMHMNAAEDHLQ